MTTGEAVSSSSSICIFFLAPRLKDVTKLKESAQDVTANSSFPRYVEVPRKQQIVRDSGVARYNEGVLLNNLYTGGNRKNLRLVMKKEYNLRVFISTYWAVAIYRIFTNLISEVK